MQKFPNKFTPQTVRCQTVDVISSGPRSTVLRSTVHGPQSSGPTDRSRYHFALSLRNKKRYNRPCSTSHITIRVILSYLLVSRMELPAVGLATSIGRMWAVTYQILMYVHYKRKHEHDRSDKTSTDRFPSCPRMLSIEPSSPAELSFLLHFFPCNVIMFNN